MSKNILFIHTEKKFKTGAHYINETIIESLEQSGYEVDKLYPEESIDLLSKELAGIANILFFHSLIKRQDTNKHYDIIQGTTYTPLAFIGAGIPIISHFGSTTAGFLAAVPSANALKKEHPELATILQELHVAGIISPSIDPLKPLKDISKIEIYVAKKSDAVIATSEKVRLELIKHDVPRNKIHLIHNAIEDYWFVNTRRSQVKEMAHLVYLGRLWNDEFTVKLKWLLRLIYIFRKYPNAHKVIIGMCHKTAEYQRFFNQIVGTDTHLSVAKEKIPKLLQKHYGDIYLNASMYEGFCLSLIEAMSQGLIPIVFAFWVVPEIIKNGVNGFIVDSLEEMQVRIDEIIHNQSKRILMAAAAVVTSEAFRSWKIIAEYIKIYDGLIAAKHAATIALSIEHIDSLKILISLKKHPSL